MRAGVRVCVWLCVCGGRCAWELGCVSASEIAHEIKTVLGKL